VLREVKDPLPGECHLNPPTWQVCITPDGDEEYDWVYPITFEEEWCVTGYRAPERGGSDAE
jgi:hypothetical protein